MRSSGRRSTPACGDAIHGNSSVAMTTRREKSAFTNSLSTGLLAGIGFCAFSGSMVGELALYVMFPRQYRAPRPDRHLLIVAAAAAQATSSCDPVPPEQPMP